jgi:hypothetical protein
MCSIILLRVHVILYFTASKQGKKRRRNSVIIPPCFIVCARIFRSLYKNKCAYMNHVHSNHMLIVSATVTSWPLIGTLCGLFLLASLCFLSYICKQFFCKYLLAFIVYYFSRFHSSYTCIYIYIYLFLF